MVKKIALVCGVALVLSVLAVTVAIVVVSAETPAHATDNGAVVFHTCPVTLGTVTVPVNVTVGGFTFNYCFDDSVTPSGDATAHFHGTLVNPSTAPSQATDVTGFSCEAGFPTGDRFTTDTQLVVTPSGEVNGTCKFH